MRNLRKRALPSESLFLLKNKSMNGDNVIDDNFRKSSIDAQLENICKLLDGEVKHYICCDRTTEHRKIVIEYKHQKKD